MNDLKFAFRQLRKSPGFTSIAVLSLAIGIGAGTAVFSLVNAILLRSLPVPNPHELRVLHWPASNNRIQSLEGSSRRVGGRQIFDAFSHPTFLALRDAAVGKADVFAFDQLNQVAARMTESSFVVDGALVSSNFFSALNIRPLIGRATIFSQNAEDGARSVVVSHDWWQRHAAGSPEVIGRSLTLNGQAFTIIGVLPKGFRGLEPGNRWDVYVELSAQSPLIEKPISDDRRWFAKVMTRLEPDSEESSVKALLNVVFAREVEGTLDNPEILLEPGHAGLAYGQDAYRKPLLVMLGIVGLVMFAACANVTGLTLARSAERAQEFAIRSALGAGRWRLFAQTLRESLAVACLGGSLGIVLAVWWRAVLARLLGVGGTEGLRYDTSLDIRVLCFSLAMVVVVALLTGLLPALRSRRAAPNDALKNRSAVAAPRLRVGRALVVAQVSLSLLLVLGAGAFARSLMNLTRIDAGFRVDHLLVTKLNLRAGTLGRNDPAQFYGQAEEAVKALPGIDAASFVHYPLLGNRAASSSFSTINGAKGVLPTDMRTRLLTVSESFFETAGIQIMQGRGIANTDAGGAAKVVVVNESFVRSYLPDENPLGLSFKVFGTEWRIVGVCQDAKYRDIKEEIQPTSYFAIKQRVDPTSLPSFHYGCLIARTALPPLALSSSVRKTLAKIDPGVTITDLRTQAAFRDEGIRRERLLAILCSVLAGVAVLLSCIGIYGLMAFNVTRRTNEIGLRMALGATRGDIARPILSEALALGGTGVAFGVPTALALAKFIRSQLYGIEPNDPFALAAGALVMLVIGLGAAWIPARRAAKTEPMVALRSE